MKPKSIYIHIPFCARICFYCDFTKMIPQKVDEYIDALVIELNQKIDLEQTYETIYFGGGTPSILSLKQLEKIFNVIKKVKLVKDYEISFEGNVESFTYEKLDYLYKNGVNRISMGMQTLDNQILKIINRDHTKEMFFEVINNAKKIGFKNINVDMMFALPNQKFEQIQYDLEQLVKLDINHISSYSLILEENSVFYKNKEKYQFLDNETEYKMYEYVMDYLKQHGYEQYEVSNYGKNGNYSKHNMVYWDAKHYIGCGLGASGFENNIRYTNTKSINLYIKNINSGLNIITEEEKLDLDDLKQEFMILGLRKTNGVSKQEFFNRFNQDIYDYFGMEIEKLKKLCLITDRNDIIKVSSKAIFVANDVYAEFIK